MNMYQHKNRIITAFVLLFGASAVETAHADHLLPAHVLECSDNFPCPEALQPRVRFWVEVFRSWSKETAIFHDPKRPERVYAVFNTGHGCNRAAKASVRRKREEIKQSLRAIAAKIESGQPITNAGERHLAALFVAQKPSAIRAASNSIRCQSGVRDSFVEGLKRYHGYRTMIDEVLRESGLPEEIRYLPFVESSYNPAAYSKAGAAGMWQIMPKTARVLGLELSATLDERLDPEAATRAAAKYLTHANQTLSEAARDANPAITRPQINPFVITSYNYGVSGMKRAIRQIEPDFMAVLERYKSPSFQIAVKNFYASFLAARHVAINAERYFGEIVAEPGAAYQTVVLEHPTSLSRIEAVFGLSEKELRPLNHALTGFVWRDWRLIPAGYRLHLPHKDHRWQAELVKLASLQPETVAAGGDRYTVRRGDTACGIARAVKVNCSELIRANQLGKTALIIAGQNLVIPRALTVATHTATYRVRRGDTACGIAKRFAVGCRTLISHNRLGRRAIIHPGQKLSIPGAAPTGTPDGLTADNLYIVRKGDSACRVAQKFSVHCPALRDLNKLDLKAIIHPGQKLKIPGLVVPETSETAQRLARVDEIKASTPDSVAAAASATSAAESDSSSTLSYTAQASEEQTANEGDAADILRNLLDTLPDLGIRVSGASDSPVYAVRVEADETLGHFADWLGIGGTAALRKMNRLSYGRPIAIGQQLKLPVDNAGMTERFEQRRTDYHQVLSESLKEHYDLVGIENHTVRRGDSPWSLSEQLGFPVWLLYRLNPVLRDTPLVPGQIVLLPKLRAKV